jgi:MoaA/NifB/PqqE/SkfB family radical SAM enzyme
MEMNKSHLRIIIKPLITSINMHEIPDLIRWTRDKGLVGVNFSPVIKWTDNCDSLWINDSNALHKLVDELLKLKQQGYPIINDEDNIRMLIPYYLESETEGKTSGFNNINDIEQVDAKKCHVGYTNLFIRPRGDLQFCDLMPYFGNVKEGNIKDIWYSKEAENIRKMTLNCKKICLQPCVVKRSLKNKFEIMFKLLKK